MNLFFKLESFYVGGEQCDQIWQKFATLPNFKSLWKFLKTLILYWEIIVTTWAIFNAFGKNLIGVSGQILKNNLAILSLWREV